MKLLKAIMIAVILTGPADILNSQVDLLKTSEAHIQRGDFSEALNVLTTHIESNPKDVKAYLKRAAVYAFLGKTSREQNDIEFAKSLNPHAYMYIDASNRSRYYEKKKYDYDFAESEQRGFNKSPVREEYYNLYIDRLVENEDQKNKLRKIIKLLSKNEIASAEFNLSTLEETESIAYILFDIYGLIELKSNRLEDALYYFNESLKAEPSYSLAYHNRAIAHTLNGNYDLALSDINKAIDINDDISVFYFTLAQLDEKLNRQVNASKNYKKAISKNPDYLEALTNHSLVMKSLGRYNESSTELLSLLNRSSNQSKASFIKGGIHLTYGEYQEAIKEFDEYLSDHIEDKAALFNRGLAKVLSGDLTEGCQDLSESIDNEAAHTNRKEIYFSFCKEH